VNGLIDAAARALLAPMLRLVREQLKRDPDPLQLREAARRVDALGRVDAGTRQQPVQAGTVAATWLDVDGVQSPTVILYLHGGAFVTETPVFHGALLGRLCRQSQARGLMLHYRLAPEHRYPAALDDAVAAYRWLLAQGHAARDLVVAGDSAGGNLALALLLRLRDEGQPLPAAVVALSPVADFTFSGDSVRRNNGIDDMFSGDHVDTLVPVYLDDRALCTLPYVSPVFGDFSGLPPLLLVVGSTELLLDDSVRIAQRWPHARLRVWHGMPHVFPGFDFLPQAAAAAEQIGDFVRECVAAARLHPVASQADAEVVAPGLPPQRDAAASAAVPAVPTSAAGRRDETVGKTADAATDIATTDIATTDIAAIRPQTFYLGLAAVSALAWLGLALTAPWALLGLASPMVWVSAATVLTVLLVLARGLGPLRTTGCVLVGLLLGPGCGLACCLYLQARRGVSAGP
jgi:epsilon-lactone hydrolase